MTNDLQRLKEGMTSAVLRHLPTLVDLLTSMDATSRQYDALNSVIEHAQQYERARRVTKRDVVHVGAARRSRREPSTKSVADMLAVHGFEHTTTGGGCDAFVRTDKGGDIEEMITSVENEAQAPTRLDERCVVVTYENWKFPDGRDGGMDVKADSSPEEATLSDILAALNNPSDEYTLLELRLHNGLHKRS